MKKSMNVSAVISNWAEIYEVFKSYFIEINIEKNISMKILIAIEEIFTNIVYYSDLNPNNKIIIECEVLDNIIKVIFTDNGKPFDITKTKVLNPQKIGGFGINIVKKVIDTIFYENINGHNKLTLIKNLK